MVYFLKKKIKPHQNPQKVQHHTRLQIAKSSLWLHIHQSARTCTCAHETGAPNFTVLSHLERCFQVKGAHVSNDIKYSTIGNGGGIRGSDIKFGLIFPAFPLPLPKPLPPAANPDLLLAHGLKRCRRRHSTRDGDN